MRTKISTRDALLQLLLEGECGVSELCRRARERGAAGLSRSSLYRLLPDLVEVGWLEVRKQLAGGRRRLLYRLSEDGRREALEERERVQAIFAWSNGEMVERLAKLEKRVAEDRASLEAVANPPITDGFRMRAPALEGQRSYLPEELVLECGDGTPEANVLSRLEGGYLLVRVEARDEGGLPVRLVLIPVDGRPPRRFGGSRLPIPDPLG